MDVNRAKAVQAVLTYPREVYLGDVGFQYPTEAANCIFLVVRFTSKGFFQGLTLVDTPSGPEFRKHRRAVKDFPDTLLVKVTAYLSPKGCSYPNAMVPEFSSPLDLGDLLSFEIAMVGSSSTVPAERISTKIREVPSKQVGSREWDYEILIRTKQAPLTDELSLGVLSKDGQLLTHITGGLDTTLTRGIYGPKGRKNQTRP